MHIDRDLTFWNFLFLLIVTLPLFESLQGQNISISQICETKQSNLGGKRHKLACSIFFSSTRFSIRDFIASLCVAFSENSITEYSINALKAKH